MFIRYATGLITGLLLASGTTQAFAKKSHCDGCGCRMASHKDRVRLVCSFQEIEMPVYKCERDITFHPCKGKSCKTTCSCQKFCKLHRKCDCTIGCDCKPSNASKIQQGALSTGVHRSTRIRSPKGKRTIRVPVMKWVTLCNHCDLLMHTSHASRHPGNARH